MRRACRAACHEYYCRAPMAARPTARPARPDQGSQRPLPRRGRRQLRQQVGRSTTARSGEPGADEAFEGARRERRATIERALEVGAGTGYFSLNLLRAGRDRRAPPRPTSRRACSTRLAATAERARASRSRRCAPTPSGSPSTTSASTSCSATPCCTTCPPRSRAGRVPPRAGARAARSPSWASPLATATGSPALPKRLGTLAAPAWRRLMRRDAERRGCGRRCDASRRDDGGSSSAWSTCTSSAPESCARSRRGGLRRRARHRRGAASPTPTAGCCGRSRRAPTRRGPARLAPVRLPQLPRAAVARREAARAAPSAEPLLQPAPVRAQARLTCRGSGTAYTWPVADRVDDIPLFPLPIVLLPTEIVPLHIFEERYKTMIGGCLDEDSEFGIIWLSDDGLKEVGCTARVTEVLERMDDGRMNILVAGREPVPAARDAARSIRIPAGDRRAARRPRRGRRGEGRRRGARALRRRSSSASPTSGPRHGAGGARRLRHGGQRRHRHGRKQGLLELRSEQARLRLLSRLFKAAMERLEVAERIAEHARGNGKVRFSS